MPPAPERPIRLEAAAGGAGGSWYVLLEGLARLVRDVHPWIDLRVVEGGGVMCRSPGSATGRRGAIPCACPSIAWGRWTVSSSELALEQIGLTPVALESWGGALVPADNYHQQLSLYRDGKVDALWQFMGIPSPSIQEAHAARSIKPLALPPDLIARLVQLGWSAAELPVGAYGVVTSPVPTVSMGTSLGFHAAVPAEVAFAITAAICDNAARVRTIHPAATAFDPARAHLDSGGPLHEGAARYFEARSTVTS